MEFSDDFLVEKNGPVYTVTFNRPEKHNCLSVSMQKELHEVVRLVRFDEEARILIFTGAGNTFCSGDDIVEFPELPTRKLSYDSATALPEPSSFPASNGFLVTSMFQETAAMIENLIDVVTIAAVDGVCMGGGLEITLCCDFVLATPTSRWGMPEIDYGLTPGWGGCTRMQKVVGRRRAREINLLAYEFTGRQAAEWGFVNRLVDGADLVTHLRQEVLKSETPIIVLANDADPRQRARFLWAGASAYHSKPLNLAEIDKTVMVLMEVAALR